MVKNHVLGLSLWYFPFLFCDFWIPKHIVGLSLQSWLVCESYIEPTLPLRCPHQMWKSCPGCYCYCLLTEILHYLEYGHTLWLHLFNWFLPFKLVNYCYMCHNLDWELKTTGYSTGSFLLNFQHFIGIINLYVGVSKNKGTPKSSILIGFSNINHPFWGTTIFGNTNVEDNFLLNLVETVWKMAVKVSDITYWCGGPRRPWKRPWKKYAFSCHGWESGFFHYFC